MRSLVLEAAEVEAISEAMKAAPVTSNVIDASILNLASRGVESGRIGEILSLVMGLTDDEVQTRLSGQKIEKANTPTIRALALNFGYVEMGKAASLLMVYQGEAEFKTAREALIDLANSFYRKFKYDCPADTLERACCRTFYRSNPDATYCAKCGSRVAITGIDMEAFTNYLYDLAGGCSDDWGGEECGSWWPWNSFLQVAPHYRSVAEIRENSEHWIAKAVDPACMEEQDRASYAEWCAGILGDSESHDILADLSLNVVLGSEIADGSDEAF